MGMDGYSYENNVIQLRNGSLLSVPPQVQGISYYYFPMTEGVYFNLGELMATGWPELKFKVSFRAYLFGAKKARHFFGNTKNSNHIGFAIWCTPDGELSFYVSDGHSGDYVVNVVGPEIPREQTVKITVEGDGYQNLTLSVDDVSEIHAGTRRPDPTTQQSLTMKLGGFSIRGCDAVIWDFKVEGITRKIHLPLQENPAAGLLPMSIAGEHLSNISNVGNVSSNLSEYHHQNLRSHNLGFGYTLSNLSTPGVDLIPAMEYPSISVGNTDGIVSCVRAEYPNGGLKADSELTVEIDIKELRSFAMGSIYDVSAGMNSFGAQVVDNGSDLVWEMLWGDPFTSTPLVQNNVQLQTGKQTISFRNGQSGGTLTKDLYINNVLAVSYKRSDFNPLIPLPTFYLGACGVYTQPAPQAPTPYGYVRSWIYGIMKDGVSTVLTNEFGLDTTRVDNLVMITGAGGLTDFWRYRVPHSGGTVVSADYHPVQVRGGVVHNGCEVTLRHPQGADAPLGDWTIWSTSGVPNQLDIPTLLLHKNLSTDLTIRWEKSHGVCIISSMFQWDNGYTNSLNEVQYNNLIQLAGDPSCGIPPDPWSP